MRKLFQPLLNILESGEGPYSYKPSHRKILMVVGGLFLVLSTSAGAVAIGASQLGGLFPCVIFFVIGFVCLVVGIWGNDRAVAKMWGNK